MNKIFTSLHLSFAFPCVFLHYHVNQLTPSLPLFMNPNPRFQNNFAGNPSTSTSTTCPSPISSAALPGASPPGPPLASSSSASARESDPLQIEEFQPPATGTRKAKVLYDYDAHDTSELSLLADEVQYEQLLFFIFLHKRYQHALSGTMCLYMVLGKQGCNDHSGHLVQ